MKNNLEVLANLLELYYKEIKICANSGAYLAACILIGAALEGALLGMIKCSPEEVEKLISNNSDLKTKALASRLGLSKLIYIAKDCGWISEDLFSSLKTIKEIRNLIHPDKYVREHPKKINKEDLKYCFNTFIKAFDSLFKHLIDSINREIDISKAKHNTIVRRSCD